LAFFILEIESDRVESSCKISLKRKMNGMPTRLIFPKVETARVSVAAESGFPRAVARPTQNCSVVVETDVAMTGAITVDVDSSEYAGHFI